MPTALVLGPVIFSGFEIPEKISIGGKQKLIIHTMPGGGRIVDAMGQDDAPIRWSGVFSGLNSGERVRTLERLRRDGTRLPLSWDAWRFEVVIQEFQAEFENSNWIPYRVELCIVPTISAMLFDWLTAAIAPILTVPLLSGAALDQQIVAAGAALAEGTLPSLVGAAGQLAQHVTRRSYSGAAS